MKRETPSADIYPTSFMRAINQWQKGGGPEAKAKRGQKLKEQGLKFGDTLHRQCKPIVYRRLALNQSSIWTFLTSGNLPETISSWTLDSAVAQGFKGGVPAEWKDGKRWFGVILAHQPRAAEIILNLEHLWVDLMYQRTLQHSDPTDFADGIRKYGNSQREVILELSRVSLKEIWSWGGNSSPIEYFASVLLGNTKKASLQWLQDLIEQNNVKLGPRWVSPAGARDVTLRALDSAKRKGFPVPADADFLP